MYIKRAQLKLQLRRESIKELKINMSVALFVLKKESRHSQQAADRWILSTFLYFIRILIKKISKKKNLYFVKEDRVRFFLPSLNFTWGYTHFFIIFIFSFKREILKFDNLKQIKNFWRYFYIRLENFMSTAVYFDL